MAAALVGKEDVQGGVEHKVVQDSSDGIICHRDRTLTASKTAAVLTKMGKTPHMTLVMARVRNCYEAGLWGVD